jgi:Fur family transcriptional regulator, ferric uptake regulator
VTVYRCMAAFEQIGVVRRAFFHNGTAMYELNVGRNARYHVVCKSTNTVEELDAEATEELRRSIELIEAKLRARGFGEVTHIVEFFGVSPQTQRIVPAPVPGLSRPS